MTMIEEQEFRDLFKEESEEHLLCMDEGLLGLEKDPSDLTRLDHVFRAAHSLKGAARMLYLPEIEMLAHRCEDVLRLGKSDGKTLTTELVAQLFPLLSAMHKLVDEALGGVKANVDVKHLLAALEQHLAGEDEVVMIEGAETDSLDDEAVESSSEVRSDASIVDRAESNNRVQQQDYRIKTIRVPTRKLDGLLNQMGELIVARGRVSQRLLDIENIAETWDEWQRSEAITTGVQRASQTGRKGDEKTRFEQMGTMIQALYHASSEDMTRLETVTDKIADEVRNIRLLPLATIFNLFPRLVRDQANEQGKKIEFNIQGGDTLADKQIVEEMKDPLMHMLRNAVDHGIETEAQRMGGGKPAVGKLTVSAYQSSTNITIEVSDDGRGIDPEVIGRTALKRKLLGQKELESMSDKQIQALIFSPGFSTSQFVTDISGRGVGMDVVRNNVERLKGQIEIESEVGRGSMLRILLPITLSSTRVLIASVNGRPYAIPADAVNSSMHLDKSIIFSIEGRKNITFQGSALHVVALSELLEVDEQQLESRLGKEKGRLETASNDEDGYLLCVVIESGNDRFGLLVDELLDEREVVVKPHGSMLKRVRNVSNVTILDSGDVCMILNPQDLARTMRKHVAVFTEELEASVKQGKQVVLLVEDSMTIRIQEKRILEGGGYEVVTAVDGLDAMNKLVTIQADAVVSDIVMPNIDGLELTAMIRRESKYNDIPIILVTALASDEDKKAGLEAGANAYISKPRFDQKILLETLGRLI